ncbi:MAG: cytochrome c3 family protein, partial [Acidobacteria bacterium]|nr:cytochrome c3 family protein [Acidobacteriota bacterium]
TFGYPVSEGKWKWKGLDDTEWALKQITITRLPVDTEDKWRSKQFHALHVQRVRALPGTRGNVQGELSCSSCHKTFNPIDRTTPRTTCGGCHNGSLGLGTKFLISQDKPNCISCHVQHVRDKRQWGSSLLAVRQ